MQNIATRNKNEIVVCQNAGIHFRFDLNFLDVPR